MRDAPTNIRVSLDIPVSVALRASTEPDVAHALTEYISGALAAQLDAYLAELPEKIDEYVKGDDDQPDGTPV